jgi:rod shape determining protein RodA
MARRNNKFFNVDWVVVGLYLVLIFIGWINIYSAVFSETHHSIFDMDQRYGKQLIWIFFALIFAFLILETDSKFFVTFSFVIYGIFIFLLILVLFLGKEVNGSRSWFEFGSVALQPAEFAKLGAALALSKILSSYAFGFSKRKFQLGIAIIILIPIVLILLQNDTGSALVYSAFLIPFFREGMSGLILFFGTLAAFISVLSLVLSPLAFLIVLIVLAFVVAYIMYRKPKELLPGLIILIALSGIVGLIAYLINGAKIDYYGVLLISSILSGLVLLGLSFWKRMQQITLVIGVFLISLFFSLTVDFAFHHVLEDHQQDRINNLLGINSDPLGAGYNVNQSKIAIGSGGLLGKGFLDGTQTKFNFVPEQSTDFIFCTIGEEWGFVGSTILIALYMLLLYRLVVLAERQRSVFSRVYGYCVASIFFFHFTVNIGMTIGLVPVIGIPLPFLSYGGSSLWFFTILLFIFLRLDANRFEQLS